MVLMGKSSIKFYKWGNHPNLIIQMAAQVFPTAAWHQKTLKKHQETLHDSTTTLLCHLGTGFLFSQVAPWCPSNVWFIDKLPRDGQEMPGTPFFRRSKMVKKFSRRVAVESHVFSPPRSSDRQPLCRLRRILTSEPGNLSASENWLSWDSIMISTYYWWTIHILLWWFLLVSDYWWTDWL